MKTILITGANGFLGSFLIRHLYKDYKIIGLKRSSSDIFRISDIISEFISYDVDKVSLSSIFENHKIDAIIHAATSYGANGNTMDTLQSNLNYPLELLTLGIKNKVNTFINTDTFYVPSYGVLQNYAISKGQFLHWLKHLSKDIKVVNLRIGIIIGPTDHRDKFTSVIIKRLLNNEPEIALTEGIQRRNFLYIEEAARIYQKVLEKLDTISESYSDFNIGTGESTSIKDYISSLHRLTKSTSILKFGALQFRENEIMDPDNDISGILKLGWHPQLSLDDSLMKTIEYEKSLI